MPVDKAKIYDDLLKLSIDLNFEDIPTPSYIQDKILDCNSYQRKVEKYSIEVTRELSSMERLYRCESLNIEVKKRQTLTNNEKIKRIPTGKEREAAVDELLEQDYQRLLDLENDVCALKDIASCIKTVQTNLKSTNSDIRVLERVMEQQINRLNIGSKDDPEIRNLNKALSELNRLEEEMTMDDVESSTESVQPEESGDEPASENPRASSEESGQDTPAAEVDSDEGISSFLVDDSSDFTKQSTEDETGEEESPAEESEEVSTPTNTSEESKGDSHPDPVPKMSLEDIDIDMGEIEVKAPQKEDSDDWVFPDKPASAEVPTKAPPEVVPEGTKGKAVETPKKEEKPAPTNIKKQEDTNVDIDDILNSL